MTQNNRKPARIFAVLAIVAAVLVLEACNTMEGIGRDLQSIGSSTERASQKSRL